MSVTNIVYKLRDKDTGKFWGGEQIGFGHNIGTRFVRRAQVESTVAGLLSPHRKHELHKTQPPRDWEIVKVELSEKELETISARSLWIRNRIREVLPKLFTDHGISFHETSGTDHFLRLREQGEMADWQFIGVRAKDIEFARKTLFYERMERVGRERSEYKMLGMGWLLFRNESTAVAAKLADAAGGVMEIDKIVRLLVERLHEPMLAEPITEWEIRSEQ